MVCLMTNRSRVKLCLMCVFAGVAANLLVAWIVVSDRATFAFATGEDMSADHARAVWHRFAIREQHPTGFEGQIYRKRGVTEILVFPHDPNASLDHGGATDWVMEWQCGWPMMSFRTGADFLPQERTFRTAIRNPYSFHLAGIGFGEYLPYEPMFPGVVVNTIFFAGLMWLVIRGPAETRRRWRELRGRCGWCALQRDGSPVCAGCGTDVTRAWGSVRATPTGEARG